MRKSFLTTFLCLFCVLSGILPHRVKAATIRFGIIGDSNSDEYRADDNRAGGTPYAATTLSWDELLVNKRDFSMGAWGTRPEPRRSGYEYNWTRSGATSWDMVNNGQPAGLAAQIRAGQIDYAFIFIGSNDFNSWNGTYDAVYSGTMSDADLQSRVAYIISLIDSSVVTLQSAGNVKILVTNYGDPGSSPDFIARFPIASKRARVTNAILQINQGIANIATNRKVALIDLYNYANTLLARVDSSGNLTVGTEKISLLTHGDEPHHAQLNDSVGHAGTVMGGLLANFFLSAMQKSYGVNVAQFSDAEILSNAGIGAAVPTATPISTPTSSCASDINLDSVVDLTDYSLLVRDFLSPNPTNPRSDINSDGIIDISDYALLVAKFLRPCP